LQWFAMSALIAVAYAALLVRGWKAPRGIRR
jgi:hypothetical protein